MVLSIVRISSLPLGKRSLRYGCKGQDVAVLQKLLNQAGFYFGGEDEVFGLLTGEAVTLFQRTFHLKVDGVAGPEVFRLLNKVAYKNGRIIYTVRKNEELSNISQRFGVKKLAWRRIPGHGNPMIRVYGGQKMLLHEKAFFCWDNGDKTCQFPVSAWLSSDFQIERNGELCLLTEAAPGQSRYHLIRASKDVWTTVLSSPKIWVRLITGLRNLKTVKFGFDLREAPLDKIIRWGDFLKFVCRNLNLKEYPLVVIPFLTVDKKLENQLYWLNLPTIGACSKCIMVDPVYNLDTPLLFESSAVRVFKDLRRLAKQGLAGKTCLIGKAEGWDWNLEQSSLQQLPYKVARLIRAQYSRAPQYSTDSTFSTLYYLKHNERHCLVYRDETGWLDCLEKIIGLNLFGIALCNFKDLGKVGPEIIASSFKVLPEESLKLN